MGKQLKRFHITTGICVTYLNDFEVHVYNIQRPAKENVPTDNSYDYYMRVVLARKVAAKKAAQVSKAPTLANCIQ